MDWKKINYFDAWEFECSCCGQSKMDEEFIEKLETAREKAKVSFSINSGYRCPLHNETVGSTPTSSHVKGVAADIHAATSRKRFLILEALIKAGFNRIGVAKSFIHVDLDQDKPGKVAWLY